jgi:50S ribosomal protein L16 3-hydroxylase
MDEFKQNLLDSEGLIRNPLCRFAYYKDNKDNNQVTEKEDSSPFFALYINGCRWEIDGVTLDLIEKIANNRSLPLHELLPFLDKAANETFLFELWKLEWLEFLEQDEVT